MAKVMDAEAFCRGPRTKEMFEDDKPTTTRVTGAFV
jgi:hypothetical protein